MAWSARDAESVLDAAQNRHAAVQPAIGVEIPSRNQEQADTLAAVFAAESGEIHIFADGNAPEAARLL